MKIYNLGSMNIDYVYRVPYFLQPGETLSSRSLEIFPGGKGLNQSVALGRAGAEAVHGGFAGSGSGFLLEILAGAGVDISAIRKTDRSPGHAMIQVEDGGQNCILLYPGTNHMVDRAYIEDFLAEASPGDILLLQNECSGLSDAFAVAKEKEMQIAFNPSPFGEELLQLPLEQVDWWFCNEIEGAALFGKGSPEILAKSFAARYPGKNLILTLGGEGSLFVTGDALVRQDIFPVQAVDTTAAGDTFTGFFLAAIAQGKEPAEAMGRAARASSIAVSRMGAAASIPWKNEVEV